MRFTREATMWCLALFIAGMAAEQLWSASVRHGNVTAVRLPSSPTTHPMPSDSLAAMGSAVIAGNVFRVARRASGVPFEGTTESGRPVPPTHFNAAPKLRLSLKAILGGPPWQGVIDGFPGHESGLLVSAGDTVGRFTVRSVGRDTVTIQAPDTLYRLTLTRDGQ